MDKRALTDEDKKEVISEVLEIWKKYPKLRLGQLIENAVLTILSETNLFFIEDSEFVEMLKKYNEYMENGK